MARRAKIKIEKDLVIIAVAVIILGAYFGFLSFIRLSTEEIQQKIDPQIREQLTYFENEYDCQGAISFEVDYSELEIQWEPFSLEQGHFDTRGRIAGHLPIVVDAPVAYPYLEKDSYGLEDAKGLGLMASAIAHEGNYLEEWNDYELPFYSFGPELENLYIEFLDSQGNIYRAIYRAENDCYMSKNGKTVFKIEPAFAGACPWCNGTGGARYNYGSSDLEAILSGNDPFTYGKCGSCGGSGRAK